MDKKSCCVCGKKIPDMHPRFGGLNQLPICMGCEGEEIDVWHVTLPGEKNGYYEINTDHVVDMLNECLTGEGYTIVKKRINAGVYHNLPEFTGF